MVAITDVTLTAGVPTAGTGTASTLDKFDGPAGSSTTRALTVQGIASGTAVPVSVASIPSHAVTNAGTFAVQSAATLAAETTKNIGTVRVGDGTNTSAVKAASTAAVATDPALVVALSPNNVLGTITATSTSLNVNVTNANTNVQSGAPVTTIAVVPTATANGATASRVNAAASTNATSLKASAGQIYSIDVYNPAAYTVFLKLYNKASSPTVGTDTPVWTIPVPAGGGFSKEFPRGKTFATGIAYAITKLQADSDTTVVVALDLTGTIDWI